MKYPKSEWNNDFVNIQSCSAEVSLDSSEKIKNKLLAKARLEAIETLSVRLSSDYKKENICSKYENGEEKCNKYISLQVQSFSKGSLEKSKYSFFQKKSLTCIKLSAQVKLDTIADQPLLTSEKEYKKEVYETKITNPVVLNSLVYTAYVNGDFNRAIFYLNILVEKNNPTAEFNLAFLYAEGIGVLQNIKKAKKLYDHACINGEMSACVNLGMMYEEGKGMLQDYSKAKNLYEKACNNNESLGCLKLGSLYKNGEGVEKNLIRAHRLSLKSCRLGDDLGCLSVGSNYHNGKSVEKNIAKAITYYLKVSESKDIKESKLANRSLGGLYATNEEIKQDVLKAIYYYNKACEQGDSDSCSELGVLYELGEGINNNISQAKKLYEKSCDLNNSSGCYYLGNLYLNGHGVEKDIGKAAEMFVKACHENEGRACFNVGAMYEGGIGISKNKIHAMKYYKKACENYSEDGCLKMGYVYQSGLFGKINPQKALFFYKKACETVDSAKGCLLAGNMYYTIDTNRYTEYNESRTGKRSENYLEYLNYRLQRKEEFRIEEEAIATANALQKKLTNKAMSKV